MRKNEDSRMENENNRMDNADIVMAVHAWFR